MRTPTSLSLTGKHGNGCRNYASCEDAQTAMMKLAYSPAYSICADCGSVLYQQRYQTEKQKQDCYLCGSYKKRTKDCTAHFIRTDLLTAGIIQNLRKVTSYAANHEARFVKLITSQNEAGSKRKAAAMKKSMEEMQNRIADLNKIIKRLYEDNVLGKITDARFMELSQDYEAEQAELKERLAAMQGEKEQAKAASEGVEKFMTVVRRHMNFEELTHTLLREFVEKIVVHEAEDTGSGRKQQIDIYYSFIGKV